MRNLCDSHSHNPPRQGFISRWCHRLTTCLPQVKSWGGPHSFSQGCGVLELPVSLPDTAVPALRELLLVRWQTQFLPSDRKVVVHCFWFFSGYFVSTRDGLGDTREALLGQGNCPELGSEDCLLRMQWNKFIDLASSLSRSWKSSQ